MSIFSSRKEKRYWLSAAVVLFAIFSSLVFGQPLAALFGNQDIQALIFLSGLILTAATVVFQAFKIKPAKFELMLWIGIAAVYLMVFLRLGLPERTHLFEYSVLAIFIYEAWKERSIHGKTVYSPILLSIIMAVLLGVLDECLQFFIPSRVFDLQDMVFNTLAVLMAVGSSFLISKVRNWFVSD